MTAGTRIIVLGRPPLLGASKTRLAADVGSGASARLARAFLADTWAAVSAWVSGQPDVDLVLAQEGPPEGYPLLLPTPTTVRQAEGDLGRRMATLVAGGLGQRARVLLLGTDSPGLPQTHLAAAVAALDDADIVLGPNKDGGFWCLGVRGGPPALWGNTWLDDLDWEVDGTREQVEERARRMSLKVAQVPEWFDIDRADDLADMRQLLDEDKEHAPETAAALAAPEPELSVVVAALNENVGLDACLEALREQPAALELIVADGGSTDRSAERAAASDATVVVTGPGRGRQFAAGAKMSTAPVLLFLHTDTRLPPGAPALVRAALDAGAEAGAFVTRTVADARFPNRAGPLLRLADIRSRITRHPYGDQGLFVQREVYEAVGGFRPLPIMEDYDLSVRLAARKPLARVKTPVTVSGRRMQQQPISSFVLMRIIPPLYRMGVNPNTLARIYRNR
ncbi:MAG: TIGR04283 family arsenosugar biosynthesis glycosyltransferase [Planctomycetota bacterium]